MFGLDQLFDFDKNGKLDAFERAYEMSFLYSAEEDSRKSDRRCSGKEGFDKYGSGYGSEEDDNEWDND